MAQATRRTLLGSAFVALPLAPAAAALAATAISADAAAEAAWSKWQNTVFLLDYGTSPEGRSKETDELWMDQIGEAERELLSGPPSLAAAAGVALIELHHETPLIGTTLSAIKDGDDAKRWLAVLRHLRPALGGEIGKAAARLLDNPDRKVDDMIHGCTCETRKG